MPKDKIVAKVGQVYRDRDPRNGYDREVTVIKIVGDAVALVESNKGKRSRIGLDRLTSNNKRGYELIREASE